MTTVFIHHDDRTYDINDHYYSRIHVTHEFSPVSHFHRSEFKGATPKS